MLILSFYFKIKIARRTYQQDCGGDPNDKCGHDDRMMVYEVYPRPWLNGPGKFTSVALYYQESIVFNQLQSNFQLHVHANY